MQGAAGLHPSTLLLVIDQVGYPHDMFSVFAERARAAGLRVVTHAGEEGPPSYVSEAVWGQMKAERIDHGVRSIEDPDLCAKLAKAGVGAYE